MSSPSTALDSPAAKRQRTHSPNADGATSSASRLTAAAADASDSSSAAPASSASADDAMNEEKADAVDAAVEPAAVAAAGDAGHAATNALDEDLANSAGDGHDWSPPADADSEHQASSGESAGSGDEYFSSDFEQEEEDEDEDEEEDDDSSVEQSASAEVKEQENDSAEQLVSEWSAAKRRERADADAQELHDAGVKPSLIQPWIHMLFSGASHPLPYMPSELSGLIGEYALPPADAAEPIVAVLLAAGAPMHLRTKDHNRADTQPDNRLFRREADARAHMQLLLRRAQKWRTSHPDRSKQSLSLLVREFNGIGYQNEYKNAVRISVKKLRVANE